MTTSPLELRKLIGSNESSERAYADALLRMAWARAEDVEARSELLAVLAELRASSRRSHAQVRARIASGELARERLRELFEAVLPLERDHFVEEVLGIAYPPLDEGAPGTDSMSYAPSGYDEIVYAFDRSGLTARDRFLDLGAGLGKVVLLAELLTGAASFGIDCDAELCALGNDARRELGLPGVQLLAQDARELASVNADVVFMYLPFSGEVLAAVMARLLGTATRPRCLCTGALDLARYPELLPLGAPQSWLNLYAMGAPG